MSGFRRWFCKGSLTKVHYPKLYNMAHLLAFNVLPLLKDLTIIFIISLIISVFFSLNSEGYANILKTKNQMTYIL